MSALLSRRAVIRAGCGFGALALLSGCGASAVSGLESSGPKLRHIGYLSGNTSRSAQGNSAILRQALRELGYVEGRDFVFDFRVAENDTTRLPAMASELVALPVDVMVTEAAPAALAAKQATSTIPVVFFLVTAPVEQGIVASLARPGGNVTGVTTHSGELSGKRLEWLRETVPGLARVAMLWNANFPSPLQGGRQDTEDSARTLGLDLQSIGVHDPAELDAALDSIARQRPDAVLAIAGFGSVCRDLGQVPDFAATIRLPQMYADPAIARAGGLMAVGPNYDALTRRAAAFIDRIFKGARPADLPVELPTQFELVINLSMARRIGLTIPDGVLRQATEVLR